MFGKFEFTISPQKRIVLNLIIVFLMTSGLIWFINIYPASGWDFRNNLWGPAYLLSRGQSPYKISALFESSNAVWLPMVIGTFFPLGWLPLKQASNLWLVGNVAGLLTMIWLSIGLKKPSVVVLATAILAVFVFPPIASHLRLGQFTIIATFIFLVVGIWNKKLPQLLSVFLISVALSKPQLAIFTLPGLFLSIKKNQGTKSVTTFVSLLFLCIVVLTIPLFLGYSSWWSDFISSLSENHTWLQPSIFTLLTVKMGKPGIVVWSGIALVLFSLNIWIWVNLPDNEAIFWSLALTPLVTPYVWSWDFVMILPLFIKSISSFETKKAFWFLWSGYILCCGIMIKMAYGKVLSEHYYWWVPWFLLIVITISYAMDKNFTSNIFKGPKLSIKK